MSEPTEVPSKDDEHAVDLNDEELEQVAGGIDSPTLPPEITSMRIYSH